MKTVIGGLLYDTKKAVLLASNRFWDGHNYERSGRNTFLYKTKNGRYFAFQSTRWQGERDGIAALSKDDAKTMYEELPEREKDYEFAFGEIPKDA